MIRRYQDSDYQDLKVLYQHAEWYGGVFDEARDGRERLAKKIADDPKAIMVYEQAGELLGTISLIEDGRVAWLYRFVVKDLDGKVASELLGRATEVLKARGHTQFLIYGATNDAALDEHYSQLGMQKGGDYTCFWKNI
jgi:hypothetical protein